MYLKIKATALGFVLVAGLAFANLGDWAQAAGSMPPWFQNATELAITLDGVNSAQGVKKGGTAFWLAIRGSRSCAEYDALWAELEAKADAGPYPINLFPGNCWRRIAGPKGKVSGVSHLLTWTYDFGENLPARPAVILGQAARSPAGVIDTEVWRSTKPSVPNVLAMYGAGECPTATVQDDMIEAVTGEAGDAGLEVSLFKQNCYENLLGPIYVQFPQAGTIYVHLRQIIEG